MDDKYLCQLSLAEVFTAVASGGLFFLLVQKE